MKNCVFLKHVILYELQTGGKSKRLKLSCNSEKSLENSRPINHVLLQNMLNL